MSISRRNNTQILSQPSDEFNYTEVPHWKGILTIKLPPPGPSAMSRRSKEFTCYDSKRC